MISREAGVEVLGQSVLDMTQNRATTRLCRDITATRAYVKGGKTAVAPYSPNGNPHNPLEEEI